MGKGASKDAGKIAQDKQKKELISTSVKNAVLIFGGCGSLGSVVVRCFKTIGYNVITVDFRVSQEANHTILLDGSANEMDQVNAELIELGIQYEAIICVAGGFRMGNLKTPTLLQDLSKMYDYNVKSAVSASIIATTHLRPGGILILTGACAALNASPDLIAYGVSKAATHHLIRSLAQKGSGLPEGAIVTAILPVMLNTEDNRKAMPDSNMSNWTPLETVASRMIRWTNGNERPENGTMVVVKTESNNTKFIPVKPNPFILDELQGD